MQFWYVNRKREQIFDRPALLVFVLTTIAVLSWLFPQQTVFRQEAHASEVDAVSIAYLEVLLKAAPDDHFLRLNLANQLRTTGQLDEAYKVLKPLVRPYPAGFEAESYLAELALASALLMQKMGGSTQAKHQEHFMQLLADAPRYELLKPHREMVSKIALAHGQPDVSAEQLVALASDDKDRAEHWLNLAARDFKASEQHERVAAIYVDLSKKVVGALEYFYLEEASKALQMLGKHQEALGLYEPYLAREHVAVEALSSVARLSLHANKPDQLREALMRLNSEHHDDPTAVGESLALALQAGELEIAHKAGEQLLDMNPRDADTTRLMAQISEWQGNPAQALGYWKTLSELTVLKGDLGHVQYLANALYDYRTVIELLTNQSKRSLLSEKQVDALIAAYELYGKPEQAIVFFTRYLRPQKNQLFAWRALAELQDRMLDSAGAINTVLTLSKSVELEVQDHKFLARMYWQLDQHDEALSILEKISSNAPATDREFWVTLAQIAWEQEQDDVLLDALAVLDEQGLDDVHASMLLSVRDPSVREWQTRAALDAWKSTEQARFLLSYMSLVWQQGDKQAVEDALGYAKENEAEFAQHSYYWMLRAALLAEGKQDELASQYYQRALALSNESSDVVSSYMWFANNARRLDDLKQAVQRWSARATRDPELWPVFAVANATLGKFSNASRYFSTIAQAGTDDLNILNAYADVLELNQQANEAWRLRNVVADRTDDQAKLSTEKQLSQDAMVRLASQLYGNRFAEALALETYEQRTEAEWLLGLTDVLIANDRHQSVPRWRQIRLEKEHLQLPVFQRVSMAYLENNHEAMQALLNEDDGEILRPAMRSGLNYQLGKEPMAMAEALENLEQEAIESQRMEMRRLLSQQVDRWPSGVKLGSWQKEQGNLNVQSKVFAWAQLFENSWHSRSTLNINDYDSDLFSASFDQGNQLRLNTELSRILRDGAFKIRAFADSVNEDTNLGFGVERQWQWDSALSTRIGAAWRDKAEQTALLSVFGQSDYVHSSVNYSPNARNTFSINAQWHQIYSRESKAAIGEGSQMGLSLTHRLNFADPEWLLTVSVEQMRNSLSAVPQDILSHFSDPLQIGDGLLPERYGQLSIGTRIQHGDVHDLNHRVPSPRYFLELATAYQWPNKDIGITAGFGIGMPLLGGDDLSLSYRFNSQPLGGEGDAAQDIQLSYNYRFGR